MSIFHKYNYFMSFEAGNCVSNSIFELWKVEANNSTAQGLNHISCSYALLSYMFSMNSETTRATRVAVLDGMTCYTGIRELPHARWRSVVSWVSLSGQPGTGQKLLGTAWSIGFQVWIPSDTWIQCWTNVGPPSATVSQHWSSIGSLLDLHLLLTSTNTGCQSAVTVCQLQTAAGGLPRMRITNCIMDCVHNDPPFHVYSTSATQ